MWILNRDVLKNWKDLDTVIYFRLKEFAYISKRWIRKALLDPEVYLFDSYKRLDMPFEKDFLFQIIMNLNKNKEKLLKEFNDEETRAFIEIFVNNLINIFTEMFEI